MPQSQYLLFQSTRPSFLPVSRFRTTQLLPLKRTNLKPLINFLETSLVWRILCPRAHTTARTNRRKTVKMMLPPRSSRLLPSFRVRPLFVSKFLQWGSLRAPPFTRTFKSLTHIPCRTPPSRSIWLKRRTGRWRSSQFLGETTPQSLDIPTFPTKVPTSNRFPHKDCNLRSQPCQRTPAFLAVPRASPRLPPRRLLTRLPHPCTNQLSRTSTRRSIRHIPHRSNTNPTRSAREVLLNPARCNPRVRGLLAITHNKRTRPSILLLPPISRFAPTDKVRMGARKRNQRATCRTTAAPECSLTSSTDLDFRLISSSD
eukprot:m.535729 g.535729  ORF g.535729 m.535729 type:complete len:314 (-) comp57620_c0_seq1:1224-2165(-)